MILLLSNFFQILWQQIVHSSYLEIIAALCGIVSVWFASKENILVYPIGIISTAIYVYILFVGKLYAVAGINLYYTVVSIYGWYAWSHVSSDNTKLKITHNSKLENLIYFVVTCVIFAVIYFVLREFTHNDISYTDSYVIYLDSFTSSLFAVAMILEARKKVESWIYWIIADTVSVPFYFSQGFAFTSVQYLVFVALAVAAYVEWRKRAE